MPRPAHMLDMASDKKRHPAGTPVGGEFAAQNRAEGDVELGTSQTTYVAEKVLATDIQAGDYIATEPIAKAVIESNARTGFPAGDDYLQRAMRVPLRKVVTARTTASGRVLLDVGLDGWPWLIRPGMEVTRVVTDSDGASQLEAIESMSVRVAELSPAELKSLTDTWTSIDVGAFSDDLWDAQQTLDGMQRDLSTGEGGAIDLVDYQTTMVFPRAIGDSRDAASGGQVFDHPGYQAFAITAHIAQAVSYRNFIGDPRFPRWTQDAYDCVTGAWRTVVGKPHPEDSDTLRTW